MSEALNENHTSNINSTIVGAILNYVGMGKGAFHDDHFYKETNEHLQPATETAPANFEKGKVVEK